MYKKVQIFIIFFLILIIFFLNKSEIFASDNFYDDFTSKDTNKWTFYLNGGNAEIVDNNLLLTSNVYQFPLVINKNNNIFPTDRDFSLNINFKYNHNGFMGNGLGVGFTGFNGKLFFQFGIWRDAFHGAFFFYNDFNTAKQGYCSNFSFTDDISGRKYINLNLDDQWHVFKIK